jgi:hypothetical protein
MAAAIAAAPNVSASTITYSGSIGSISNVGTANPGSTATVDLQQFNPALGILTGISVSYDFTGNGSVTVYNLGGPATTLTSPFYFETDLSDPQGSLGDPPGNLSTSAASISIAAAPLSQSPAVGPLNTTYTETPDPTDPAVLLAYEGLGTAAYSATVYGGTGGTSGGPIDTEYYIYGGSQSTANIDTGDISVAYTYTPVAVPEPASLSLLGIGSALLLVRRRRLQTII